jgi:hypothetical protein
MLDVDDGGNVVQRVRKTENHILTITKLPDWDSVVPDAALSALDQRIIEQTKQIKMLTDLANILDSNKVDNIVYDDIDETLQLSAKGKAIGNKISVRDMLDDGIPVVELGSGSGNDQKPNNNNGCDCGCEDNVVEFDNYLDDDNNIEDENNVVEF